MAYLQAGIVSPGQCNCKHKSFLKSASDTETFSSPTAWLRSLSQMYIIRVESLAVMDLWPENDPIVVPTCGPETLLRDAGAPTKT